jgi:hypothetical protein
MEEALLDLLPGAPVYHLGLYRYVLSVPLRSSSSHHPTSYYLAASSPISNHLAPFNLLIRSLSRFNADNQRPNLPPSNRILLPPTPNYKRRPYLHSRSNGSYWKYSISSIANDERMGIGYGKGLLFGDYWESESVRGVGGEVS